MDEEMITRIEGPRPLEAAPTVATNLPRAADEVKNKEEPKRAQEGERAPDEATTDGLKPYALSFRFDKELNRVLVKVIDPETGELLREIPPESIVAAMKQLKQTIGRLVDEEA